MLEMIYAANCHFDTLIIGRDPSAYKAVCIGAINFAMIFVWFGIGLFLFYFSQPTDTISLE